jgi:dTDP-glucose 4,6-dehydratase
MTSIVSGGAGFLGSHLVDRLVKRGASVVVIDNLATGHLVNLEHAISSGRVTFVYADIVDVASLHALLASNGIKKVGAIYHFASTGAATLPLIDLALRHRSRFIFSSLFGASGDEGDVYGEAAVTAAVRTDGLDARIVRFVDCYGPRMQSADDRFIPALLEAAVNGRALPIEGTGEEKRTLTFVADALALLLLGAEAPPGPLVPLTIGSDDERSVIEIAKSFARAADVAFTPQFVARGSADPQRRRPDLTRARELGWKPTTALETGLRMTYAWFSRDGRLFV